MTVVPAAEGLAGQHVVPEFGALFGSKYGQGVNTAGEFGIGQFAMKGIDLRLDSQRLSFVDAVCCQQIMQLMLECMHLIALSGGAFAQPFPQVRQLLQLIIGEFGTMMPARMVSLPVLTGTLSNFNRGTGSGITVGDRLVLLSKNWSAGKRCA